MTFSKHSELGNRVYKLVSGVWNTFIDQLSYSDGSLNEHLDNVVAMYVNISFNEESKLNIFKNLEAIDEDNFEKRIQKRFKFIRDIFVLRKQMHIVHILAVCRLMTAECHKLAKAGGGTDLFVSKYVHFMMFVSQIIFGVTYSYGYHSYLNRLTETLA